jgi:catechol 2,3-dioxygenase-like lactoylglutathione lyase family enzyme
MSIDNLFLNVADVPRSVEFYERFLGAHVVGEVTPDHALLDFVSATFELVRLDNGQPSSWRGDDLHKGFRHIGFKVPHVDALVAKLKAADVPFHLDPLDAEGGVRISFFFDPDGTLLELVEGDLQYHEIANEAGVLAERALGIPARPRFDHVAITVGDLSATEGYYAPLGFSRIGTIHQAHDPRGFEINFLKSDDTVLEIFTYAAPKQDRPPQLNALGFVAARFTFASTRFVPPEGSVVGESAAGEPIFADADGFTFSLAKEPNDGE